MREEPVGCRAYHGLVLGEVAPRVQSGTLTRVDAYRLLVHQVLEFRLVRDAYQGEGIQGAQEVLSKK